MAKFSMLFSGSSGNSAYVGFGERGVLIDAGVSAKRICTALQEIGTQAEKLDGIFITHEHMDHIKGLSVLSRRAKLPVYLNEETLAGIRAQGIELEEERIHLIQVGEPVVVGEMQVTSFPTMHDAKCSVGYVVETPDGRKLGYATDLGVVTPEVERHLCGCHTVALESNHDEQMLRDGRYPFFLKVRILSEIGHLSNRAAASLAAHLGETGTTRFILAHLSRENNRPELARRAAEASLREAGLREGYDFELECPPPAGGRVHIY